MSWSRLFLSGLMAAAAPMMAAAQPSLTPHDLMLLNRVTWGATPADAAEMQKLGPRRWLERQLHPSNDDGLPQGVQAVIAELPAVKEPMAQVLEESQAIRPGNFGKAKRPAEAAAAMSGMTGMAGAGGMGGMTGASGMAGANPDDAAQRQALAVAYKQYLAYRHHDAIVVSLMRDIYSQNQLLEQMTWFWFNHFNVFSHKRDIRAMLVDYENGSIRPHALGKFRDLLEATLRHPAMLRYLDNEQNAAGKINENYARELMELHTLGVGSGYTQNDVQELARILTGVGVDEKGEDPQLPPELKPLYVRQGVFVFNPKRHDFGDKLFLGHHIKGSGFAEVEQALDILSREPATARHISRQLATYFVGDNPPPALVERLAQTFQRSDGDIAEVLRALFESKEFDASLGTQFKDPMHYVISAARLEYADKPVININPMIGWLGRLSEAPYDHETPDGYPLDSGAWNGPGQLAARFEIARDMAAGQQAFFTPPNRHPEGVAAQPEIRPVVQQVSLDSSLGPPTKAVLGQASTPLEWNALFLSSPEFMRR